MSILWENTVDHGAFACQVTRTSAYSGRLRVWVTDGGTLLLDKEVSLSYGAIMGPDVDDVADWQVESLAVIDKHITEQGGTA